MQPTPLAKQSEPVPVANPWAPLHEDAPAKQENWLLSYIDLLTLLLTLLVVLLALQRQHDTAQEPIAAVTEETAVVEMARAVPVTPPPVVDKEIQREPEQQEADPMPQPPEQAIAKGGSPRIDPQPLIDVLNWNGLTDGITISATEEQLRLETSDEILFATASANLTERGELVLADLANVLRLHPGAIAVEGHADNTPIIGGDYPSNWELSAARAARVVRFLVEGGVSAERLRAIGYSDTQPKADNETREGRAANRRVSLVLDLEGGEPKKRETTAEFRVF